MNEVSGINIIIWYNVSHEKTKRRWLGLNIGAGDTFAGLVLALFGEISTSGKFKPMDTTHGDIPTPM